MASDCRSVRIVTKLDVCWAMDYSRCMKYPELLAGLREIGDSVTLRKKSHVAFQGEVPRYGYYVLDGAVKAYFISSEGIQTIVDIYAKHSMLPMGWLSRSSTTALFYYEAITDVRAVRFRRDDFENLLETDADVHKSYTNYLAATHAASLFRANGLCQPHASHKVCYALYFLVSRYGVEQSDGEYMIPIPLTHEIIASFIGQSRENTAKTIKKLSDDGIIQYASKTYVVRTTLLEHYLGEDGFRELVASSLS